ncbi:MAG: hypothetical protein ACRC2B_00120 [Rubrivivax sp.]
MSGDAANFYSPPVLDLDCHEGPVWSIPLLFVDASPPGAADLGRRLERVFDLDLEHCPNCGGEPKIIAATIEEGTLGRL